jgi:16S rRNA (guanine527-N7)-methyltransferase
MTSDLELGSRKDRARAESLVDVPRETWMALEPFVAALERWQAKTNLVAPTTLPELWTRHIADSLQLLPLAPAGALTWIDLGSGGGFPAIPVAAALKQRPGFHMHLVESVQRKAAFLREAIRLLHLPATMHNLRIEQLPVAAFGGHAEVLSARALAPLTELFAWAQPLFGEGTVALFPKGQDVAVELEHASRYWDYEAELIPSVTERRASIVRVTRLARRAPGEGR